MVYRGRAYATHGRTRALASLPSHARNSRAAPDAQTAWGVRGVAQKLTEPTTWMNELTVISLQDMAPEAVKATLRDELVVQVTARLIPFVLGPVLYIARLAQRLTRSIVGLDGATQHRRGATGCGLWRRAATALCRGWPPCWRTSVRRKTCRCHPSPLCRWAPATSSLATRGASRGSVCTTVTLMRPTLSASQPIRSARENVDTSIPPSR